MTLHALLVRCDCYYRYLYHTFSYLVSLNILDKTFKDWPWSRLVCQFLKFLRYAFSLRYVKW